MSFRLSSAEATGKRVYNEILAQNSSCGNSITLRTICSSLCSLASSSVSCLSFKCLRNPVFFTSNNRFRAMPPTVSYSQRVRPNVLSPLHQFPPAQLHSTTKHYKLLQTVTQINVYSLNPRRLLSNRRGTFGCL